MRDRIDYVREKLGSPEEPISYRELARRAGLSEPAISMFLGRLEKDPDASMNADSLLDIANAGRVHPRWLRSGIGPRDDDRGPTISYAASTTPAAASREPGKRHSGLRLSGPADSSKKTRKR